MSIRNNFTKKKRILTCSSVAALTAVVVSALFFVGCKGRFFFIVPGLVFIMFTVVAIGIFCQAYCDIISRKWSKTVGFIRRAEIVRSYISAGGKHASNSSPCHTYSLDVDYDYAVGGKNYKGSRISFVKKGYVSWKEADCARRILMKDKNINVYYCPSIPSWSCISHVQIADIVISVCFAVASSVVSLIFTLFAYYYLP